MKVQRISIHEILDRYNSAFGYDAMKVAARFIHLPVYSQQDADFSKMIFENSISGKRYSFGIDIQGNVSHKAKSYLAPPPLVRFYREKHVVETAIDRGENTVIENFGNKAYQININGILIDSEEHKYPDALIKELHEMFAAKGTYKVTGEIFETLEIYEIFLKSNFSIEFVEGFVDTVKYSISAVSVDAAEFQLLN